MQKRTIAFLAALVTVIPLCAEAALPRTFILVIDGMEPENVSRDLTPVLCDLTKCDGRDVSRLAAKSASYLSAQAIVTTTTNANHAAMVTGAYADANGVVANNFFDRDAGVSKRTDDIGLLLAETFFTTINKAGVPVITAGVVGKGKIGHLLLDCANASGCGPAFNRSPDFVVEGTAPNNCQVEPGDPHLEEEVESCLLVGEPATGDERSTDTLVMNEILLLSQTHDPNVFFVNLPDVDNLQHVFGVRSVVALSAIANVDKQIGRLIQYLKLSGKWNDAILIVLADHSFGDVGDPLPHGNDEPEMGAARTFSLTENLDVRVNNPLTGRPELGITNTRIVMPDLLKTCVAAGRVGPCPTAPPTGSPLDLCVQLYDTGMAGVVALTPAGTAALSCAVTQAGSRQDCIEDVRRNPKTTDDSAGAAEFPADWHLDTQRAADLVFTAKDRCALLDSQTSTSSVLSGDHGHLTARHIPFIIAGGPGSMVKNADPIGGQDDTRRQAKTVDVAPTVLAIYGVSPPLGVSGQALCDALSICP